MTQFVSSKFKAFVDWGSLACSSRHPNGTQALTDVHPEIALFTSFHPGFLYPASAPTCFSLAQLCATMDCLPPSPSVPRILQAGTLGWAARALLGHLPSRGWRPSGLSRLLGLSTPATWEASLLCFLPNIFAFQTYLPFSGSVFLLHSLKTVAFSLGP